MCTRRPQFTQNGEEPLMPHDERLPAVVEFIPPRRARDLAVPAGQAVEPSQAFAGAMRDAVGDLQGAITRMDADEISLDIEAYNNGPRTDFKVKLRAYRHRGDQK
jgi:hypothetical protein